MTIKKSISERVDMNQRVSVICVSAITVGDSMSCKQMTVKGVPVFDGQSTMIWEDFIGRVVLPSRESNEGKTFSVELLLDEGMTTFMMPGEVMAICQLVVEGGEAQ